MWSPQSELEEKVCYSDKTSTEKPNRPYLTMCQKRRGGMKLRHLVKILDNYRNRISAIIYCPRLGTPDAYKQLKTSGIPILSVKKNLVSKRQQQDSDLLIKLSLLHQPYHLELKSLSIIFKYSDKLKAQKTTTPRKIDRHRRKESSAIDY